MTDAPYFDFVDALFRAYHPGELSAQQKANYTLFRGLLEAEFERGFQRGRSVAALEYQYLREGGCTDGRF